MSDVDPMIAAMFGDLEPIPEHEVAALLELAGIPDQAIERSAVPIVRQGLAHGIRATRPDLARQARQARPSSSAGASSTPAAPSSSAAPPGGPAGASSGQAGASSTPAAPSSSAAPPGGPAGPSVVCPVCFYQVRIEAGRLARHGPDAGAACVGSGMAL